MKYLIKWNVGWGHSYKVVEADSKEEAENMAYESWKDEVESDADYSAKLFTEEIAEEYDLEDEL